MDPATQLGFQFAKEVSTQLITLSTGLLTLTITFTKEIFRAAPRRGGLLLPLAWATHVLAIVLGVWALMALTGTLMPGDLATRKLEFGANVRIPAGGQIGAFALGTAFLFFYGLLSFRTTEPPESVHRAITVPLGQLEVILSEQANTGWDLIHVLPTGDGALLVLFKKHASTDK